MLTIYHLEQSRSGRIIWLAEELGLDYAVETFKRPHQAFPPPEYQALHPLGRAPIIRDGDLVPAESGAIFEYLLGRHDDGKLVPEPSSPQYADYLFWLHFAEGSLSPHHLTLWVMDLAGAKGSPMWDTMMSSLAKDLAYADTVLSKQDFLAGDEFTACDIMMCLALTAPKQFADNLPPHPYIDAYLQRLAKRPAYRKARPFS
jgi:glutathione S-transferase